jgi:hypothetical protein
MTNLLEEAINSNDGDHAAKVSARHRERRGRELRLPEDVAEQPRAARTDHWRVVTDRSAVSGRIEHARKPWPATSTAATAMVVADWGACAVSGGPGGSAAGNGLSEALPPIGKS